MFLKILSSVIAITSVFSLNQAQPAPQVLGDSVQIEGDKPTINYVQKKPTINLEINISSKSALLIDTQTNQILYEKNINQKLPIASITKLMTALVFQDSNPGFEKTVIVTNTDTGGGLAHLKDGETFSLQDIFTAALVSSDNTAASVLSRSSGKSKAQFKDLMNKKSNSLGLTNTYFVEPTGLSEHNVSTAKDISKLIRQAVANEDIKKALSTKSATIHSNQQEHKLENTNQLLDNEHINIIAGKTGYTEEAGNCLVTIGQINGRQVVSVVLGSETEETRFQDTKAIYWLADQQYII